MIDVGRAPAYIRAAVLALKRAGRDLRNDINRTTRAEFNPVWRGLVQNNATYTMQSKVLSRGSLIKPGNPPVARAASSKRPLSGGLVPNDEWHAIEFGADRNAKRTYDRKSKNGGTHRVTRHTRRQLPARTQQGHVVYPAFAEMIPRVISLWVQLIVRKYAEAAGEGR